MTGLTIGEKHTYLDFGLKMLSYTISPPEPKIEEIDIPGMNEPLDVSEFFGEILYKRRKLTATFDMEEPDSNTFFERFSELCNYMHGLTKKIIPDDDSLYYYEGRIKVSYERKNALFYGITISADVAPYKMRLEETVISRDVTDELEIVLPNNRKSVIPTIITDAEFRLVFDGKSVNHSAGEFIIPTLKLTKTETVVMCYGTGNITFKYREGSL